MKDEMDKDLNGAISDEEKAAAGFEELATAKKEEISAASSAIETKTKRSGEFTQGHIRGPFSQNSVLYY